MKKRFMKIVVFTVGIITTILILLFLTILDSYIVVSPSMKPTIDIYDVVIIHNKFENINKNDIITFISTDNINSKFPITHRVDSVLENGKQFITKGDNNFNVDESLVNKDDVIGKVIFIIPKFGYLQAFLHSKYGWISIVLIPAILLIIYNIIKIKRIS